MPIDRTRYTWDGLAAAEISSGPVFRAVALGGKISVEALTGDCAARIVKKYALAMGPDAAGCGGHSLRAGYVTSAAEASAPLLKFAEQTRHKSLDPGGAEGVRRRRYESRDYNTQAAPAVTDSDEQDTPPIGESARTVVPLASRAAPPASGAEGTAGVALAGAAARQPIGAGFGKTLRLQDCRSGVVLFGHLVEPTGELFVQDLFRKPPCPRGLFPPMFRGAGIILHRGERLGNSLSRMRASLPQGPVTVPWSDG